jgi:hypothetical protein
VKRLRIVSIVFAASVFAGTSLAAPTDEPVPWPTGQAPDAFELDEQVRAATDLDALEGGDGALTHNAMLEGDGDHASSAIVRNAPAALGLGFVQVLGTEMTAELARTRDAAVARAAAEGTSIEVDLLAKGVRFGTLRANADGSLDTSRVEGIASDLVVRPFGWKGTTSHLRRFIEDAARGHFGIQSHVLAIKHAEVPDARLGEGAKWFDPDGDGKERELEEGALTATVAYLAMVESPVILPPHDARLRERWAKGSALYDRVGCASCHTRELGLENAVLHDSPDTTGGPELVIDLLADGDKPKAGLHVKLFSDLKRHDMGPELADAREGADGVARSVFLTRPLWGLAESAPYMHDGRATTIPEAILAHGGEGADSRDRFAALSAEDQASLHVFLLSLTRAPRPRVIR